MPERSTPDSWHLDKKVSIGHIMTTLAVAAAVLMAYMDTRDRLTRLEARQSSMDDRIVTILENQSAIDVRQNVEILEVKQDIREELNYIRQSLDRIREAQ